MKHVHVFISPKYEKLNEDFCATIVKKVLTYYDFKSRKACEPIIKPARHLNLIKSFHNLVYPPSIIYTMNTMLYFNNSYNNVPVNVVLAFV